MLKAAAGAPAVVFTLPYGAPVAAASLNCLEKATRSAGDPVTVVTTEQDNWVRVRVDKQIIDDEFPGFQLGSNWYRVRRNGTVENLGLLRVRHKPADGYYYIAVNYHRDGSYNVDPMLSRTDINALSTSCQASVTPGKSASININ